MEPAVERPGFVSYHTSRGIEYRQILDGAAAKIIFDAIPVIDASKINSANPEHRKEIAQKVGDAAANVGFFYMNHPPIDTRIIDDAFAVYQKFFEMSVEQKNKIHINQSQNTKGFKMEAISESFRIGNGQTDTEQHYIRKPEIGAPKLSQWPDEYLPEFRTARYRYCKEIRAFSDKLVRIFALALGLAENGLDDLFKYPLTEFTIQHYFKHTQGTKTPNLGAHTDYGGKQLSLAFSNGDAERILIPFFYSFDPSVTIRPLQLTLGEEPKYPEVNISLEHIRGLVLSLPEHPFIKRLINEKSEENGYTYDKLLEGNQVISLQT